jgi:basic amino acid/polyamine antiporter, APA family
MASPTSQLAPLGVWHLTLLVAGNIIGSGIFLLPATLAQYGSISLLAWGFTALGAVALALVFSELSAVFGEAGGFYSHCREAFGDFIGFQVAYSYWIALWVGNAALVISLTGYLSLFWPVLHENALLAWGVNVSIIWTLTLLNIFHFRAMLLLQACATLVKLLPLFLIAVVGLYFINFDHFKPFNLLTQSPLVAFNEAATITLWSFLGVESASLSGQYSINPQRDIPRATLRGVCLAAILYLGGYVALIGMMPFSQLSYSSAPYADAVRPFCGPWAQYGIGVLAVFSCLGSLVGWILLQGQMPLAAARDKLFPPIFLKENAQKVPVAGLIISSSLMTGLLLLKVHQSLVSQFTFIILLATLASLIPYFFSSMAAIMLLMKYPERFQARGSRIKFLIISSLAGLYAFWAIVGAGQSIVFYGVLLLLSSLPVYVGLQWEWQRLGKVNKCK